jgi:soluble lytic murein transglycosylase-like protein
MSKNWFVHRVVGVLALSAYGLAQYSASSAGDYTVQPGDSLWAIAQSHDTTVSQLAAANRLNPADILPIGKQLVIPGYPEASSAGAPAPTASGTSSWNWCSSFQPVRGPWGQRPSGLPDSTYKELEPIFAHWASYYGISNSLLEALTWQESGWQQGVVSPTGAVGVGQVEPYTAAFVESDVVGLSLDIYSTSDNIRVSAAYLGYLSRVEGGNTCDTIASYYEGPLAMQTYGVLPSAQQYVADVEYLQSEFQ